MPSRRILRWSWPCWILCAHPLLAQDADRIWGRVQTESDGVWEGFIRWDRNEASWPDILDGTKEIPEEAYLDWLDAWGDGERPVRAIELKGYRITWNEEDPDFPTTAASGVRFGHLERLEVTGRRSALLTLRSGTTVELRGASSDLGTGMRELVVDDPRRGTVELDWRDLEAIDFAAAPPGARPRAARLYGTVEDREGRRFTGYVSWDLDEVLTSDVLDGRDRDVTFSDVRAIERAPGGARVTLNSGETVRMTGTNDVDRGNRGVQISDPALGMIEVEWDELERLDLEPAPPPAGRDAFDGGHRLFGTVTTRSGEAVTGAIRWDADEEWSWELLNGSDGDVVFTIEFAAIARIERGERRGAHVTLRDGRTFHLDDSNDVDWDNKGIFVRPDGGDGPVRFVTWDEFRAVRFAEPPEPSSGGEGKR